MVGSGKWQPKDVQTALEARDRAKAGMTAGSTINSIDGLATITLTDFETSMAGHNPGDNVSVEWTDTGGVSHTATMTTEAGSPA